MSTATSASPAVPAPRPHPSRRRSLYRGDPGMWSWVLHRITGATIFFFLLVHVLDTALVRVSPQAYNEVINTYKTPIVGLMEMGLVAAVLYHALNGHPRHPDRLLAARSAVSAADVVDRRRRLARRDDPRAGRARHAHGGAIPVSAPWTPHHREGRLAPVQEKEHDRPASLDHPRAPRRPRGIPYFEKYAWLFMRFSGVALVFLALGHLFIGLMWDDGVYRIDFNYVAERWASPFWQIWDMALLWLAMVHGANGMRTIIGDYARKNITKFYLNSLLLLATGFTLVLGTYVLVTFDASIS